MQNYLLCFIDYLLVCVFFWTLFSFQAIPLGVGSRFCKAPGHERKSDRRAWLVMLWFQSCWSKCSLRWAPKRCAGWRKNKGSHMGCADAPCSESPRLWHMASLLQKHSWLIDIKCLPISKCGGTQSFGKMLETLSTLTRVWRLSSFYSTLVEYWVKLRVLSSREKGNYWTESSRGYEDAEETEASLVRG